MVMVPRDGYDPLAEGETLCQCLGGCRKIIPMGWTEAQFKAHAANLEPGMRCRLEFQEDLAHGEEVDVQATLKKLERQLSEVREDLRILGRKVWGLEHKTGVIFNPRRNHGKRQKEGED